MEQCQKQIDALRVQRVAFYNPSDLLPFALMDDAERKKIQGMKTSDVPCEYCEKLTVKKSKKSICVDCGHVQTTKEK